MINQERAVITKENYIDLVNIVNSLDVPVRKIEEKESYYLIEDKVIFENTLFDAEVIINQSIETASSCIHLIDHYGDIRALNAFKGKKKEVPLIIITGKHHKISDADKDNFHKKYGEIKIYVNKKYHDRYLIIDKKMFYHLGSSVNYLGKKFSQLKELGFAEVKFARDIIMKIDTDPVKYQDLVKLVNEAKTFGVHTAAVGVENETQFKLLRDADENMMVQGYYLYKPLTRSDLIAALISYEN